MTKENTMSNSKSDDTSNTSKKEPSEGGYGSPTPEDEMPGNKMPQDNESAVDLPSSEAPLDEGNAGPTSDDRESFSSEPDAEAAGKGA